MIGICGLLWCGSVEMYKEGVGRLSKFVRYEVGDGSSVWLWHDLFIFDK
jgi:hypothetical protein